MRALRVLSVASEVFPLVKTGGLADVVGALPGALAQEGVGVRTLVPGYPSVTGAIGRARTVHRDNDLFGGEARLLATRASGLDLLVLDAPHLYARPGNPYLGPDGQDWPDNAIRFAALARVAADIGGGALRGYVPDVVHAHDWQAGLAPAYLRYRASARPATVMTVHNLAFPGKAPRELLARLGLPPSAWSLDGVEFHGMISLLKAGLSSADWITTVSPTYSEEIQTEEAGMGFDGLLRLRSNVLSGILNGIDTAIWNPASDPLIGNHFELDTIPNRLKNKAALQAGMGLATDPDAPLFGVVSRLTWQKGMDLLSACLPLLRELGAQLVIVGAGDSDIETALRTAAAAAPDRIGCFIGYDEPLAHVVQAGADALVVPSRFEPCGLTQLCALRYGAVPVVARVGGLADTVIDANAAALAAGVATGVQFSPTTADALETALRAHTEAVPGQTRMACATAEWHERGCFLNGPAKRYAALYRNLVTARAR